MPQCNAAPTMTPTHDFLKRVVRKQAQSTKDRPIPKNHISTSKKLEYLHAISPHIMESTKDKRNAFVPKKMIMAVH